MLAGRMAVSSGKAGFGTSRLVTGEERCQRAAEPSIVAILQSLENFLEIGNRVSVSAKDDQRVP